MKPNVEISNKNLKEVAILLSTLLADEFINIGTADFMMG
jgi:hypothetical protein